MALKQLRTGGLPRLMVTMAEWWNLGNISTGNHGFYNQICPNTYLGPEDTIGYQPTTHW